MLIGVPTTWLRKRRLTDSYVAPPIPTYLVVEIDISNIARIRVSYLLSWLHSINDIFATFKLWIQQMYYQHTVRNGGKAYLEQRVRLPILIPRLCGTYKLSLFFEQDDEHKINTEENREVPFPLISNFQYFFQIFRKHYFEYTSFKNEPSFFFKL